MKCKTCEEYRAALDDALRCGTPIDYYAVVLAWDYHKEAAHLSGDWREMPELSPTLEACACKGGRLN
jgi:hypothetical protein